MRVLNSYILAVASLLLLTTVILTALGQNSLEVYYIFFVLGALAITELYVFLSAKTRRQLNSVSVLLFIGFLFIVVEKVVSVLL